MPCPSPQWTRRGWRPPRGPGWHPPQVRRGPGRPLRARRPGGRGDISPEQPRGGGRVLIKAVFPRGVGVLWAWSLRGLTGVTGRGRSREALVPPAGDTGAPGGPPPPPPLGDAGPLPAPPRESGPLCPSRPAPPLGSARRIGAPGPSGPGSGQLCRKSPLPRKARWGRDPGGQDREATDGEAPVGARPRLLCPEVGAHRTSRAEAARSGAGGGPGRRRRPAGGAQPGGAFRVPGDLLSPGARAAGSRQQPGRPRGSAPRR